MNPGNGHNELYEFYVLGLLEEPERGRIEEDLRRNDPAARALLRRALETNAILGTLAPEVGPSKQLRRRVLSIAEPPASRLPWNLAWVGLSACLVAGLVYTGVQRQGLGGCAGTAAGHHQDEVERVGDPDHAQEEGGGHHREQGRKGTAEHTGSYSAGSAPTGGAQEQL